MFDLTTVNRLMPRPLGCGFCGGEEIVMLVARQMKDTVHVIGLCEEDKGEWYSYEYAGWIKITLDEFRQIELADLMHQ
jgi:hypothetical protein